MRYHIPFDELEWESTKTGQRYKTYVQDGKQIRLMEITPEFEEENWCTMGHIGYVLAGVLELEFENETQVLHEGDGYFIPAGPADHHKARALTPIVRVVMVEEA